MSPLEQHNLSCDVLVAGGGPAGVATALAAARCGARVVLCHDRPVLGGNASSEIRMHMVGADVSGQRGAELETEAREGGIVEEIRLDNCVRNPQRSPSLFDLILYDKCRSEPNLTLLLDTAVTGAETGQRHIERAVAERPSTEDRFLIEAGVFVDCTGDGRLGVEAGAAYRRGREARGEFDESLAPEDADQKTLGSSLMLQARRHDRPMPFTPPTWARRFTENDLRLRPHAVAGLDLGLEYGLWWVEWGGGLDTVKQNDLIRDELLSVVLGVWDHIKNSGDHGADRWALDWFGFLPGKRESRRFVGLHTLSQRDLMQSTPFEDAIAYGGWPIDLHPPEGVDAADEPPCQQHWTPHLYDIPLRACISQTVDNLMFAGRNISATHVALASTRVMATCAAVGQGVGAAAAHSVRLGRPPSQLPADPQAIRQIQEQLLRDDAFLIGRISRDPCNLAAAAQVRASSQQPDGPAEAALSGQTRSVHGPGGAPADRARPGSHRWMSDPSRPLPAWIELRWSAPVTCQQVQLVFDTGLHRVLTFSLANDYTAKMIWGQPQPETITDYAIDVEREEGWQTVAAVNGNYQRRRVHWLPERPMRALRITARATGGLNHARICDVRVY